jgi:hypothetical protein
MSRRFPTECTRVRAALEQGKRDPIEEAHLFACASCRTEARLAAAWRSFPRPEQTEAAEASLVDERFIRGVIEQVRADARRRARNRARWAAAAALLFFFLAGASQKLASTTTATTEDSYASILTPSFGSLLPQ